MKVDVKTMVSTHHRTHSLAAVRVGIAQATLASVNESDRA
jgi:hypothetical protein